MWRDTFDRGRTLHIIPYILFWITFRCYFFISPHSLIHPTSMFFSFTSEDALHFLCWCLCGEKWKKWGKNKISSQSSVLLPRSVAAIAYMLLHSYRSRSFVREKEKNSNFDQRSLSRKKEQRAWEAYMHRFIYSSREYQLYRRVCKNKNMWMGRRCEPKLNLESRQMSRIPSIITLHTQHTDEEPTETSSHLFQNSSNLYEIFTLIFRF